MVLITVSPSNWNYHSLVFKSTLAFLSWVLRSFKGFNSVIFIYWSSSYRDTGAFLEDVKFTYFVEIEVLFPWFDKEDNGEPGSFYSPYLL